jgi:hypothetical protein
MFQDTTPEALAKQSEVLSRIRPADKVVMTFESMDNERRLAKAGIRHWHPDWGEDRVQRADAKMVLGRTLFNKVYAVESATDES